MAYRYLTDAKKCHDFGTKKTVGKSKIREYAKAEIQDSEYYSFDGNKMLLGSEINELLDQVRKKENPNFVYLKLNHTNYITIHVSDIEIEATD